MTALNKPQLYSAFADNTIGAILPLTTRSLIDSVELKYDNYTVVKTGNLDGNKFPDAVSGKITLPDNTVWIINGAVTVNYPIYCGNNVVIRGLSGSPLVDQILLDSSAGAVALLNSNASGMSLTMRDLAFQSVGGTGSVIDFYSPGIITFSQCYFVADVLGTIEFVGGAGELYMVDRSIGIVTGSPLNLIGTGGVITINSMRSGISNTDSQINITGTFIGIFINSCYNNQSSAMVSVTNDSVCTYGLVAASLVDSSSLIISGVDEKSNTFTFQGNSGFKNTSIGFSSVMDANTVATTTVSQGAWAKITGNSEDTIDTAATRFTRTSALKYTYNGIDPYNASIHLDVSAKRSAGATDTNFSFGVFKNGALVTRRVSKAVTSITRVTTTATLTLTAAFEGLKTGQTVTISGATPAQYNGTFVITRTSSTVFTYTMASDPGASASGTILALLPIEIVSTVALHDNLDSCTVVFNEVLNTGDYIEPYLRSDDSGVINGLVQSLMITVT